MLYVIFSMCIICYGSCDYHECCAYDVNDCYNRSSYCIIIMFNVCGCLYCIVFVVIATVVVVLCVIVCIMMVAVVLYYVSFAPIMFMMWLWLLCSLLLLIVFLLLVSCGVCVCCRHSC